MEWISTLIDWLVQAWGIITHLDAYLNEWIAHFGPFIYVILFAVIFCETGLVITPFLPGDSFLFALGALAAGEKASLNIGVLMGLLIVAGILGDAANYLIGKKMGPKVFHSETSRFLNRKHLKKTQDFYEKYGGKTIVLARFIPIIRTFAPFVAGIGQMQYRRFAIFNIFGAVIWVTTFLLAGFFFGNLPMVKQNFHIVIFAIIIVSILPAGVEMWRARREQARASVGSNA